MKEDCFAYTKLLANYFLKKLWKLCSFHTFHTEMTVAVELAELGSRN